MKRLLVFGVLAFGCGIAANADEVLLIPDIAPISDAPIRAPLVVEKIKRGEMTAEEAWQRGELNEETLLFLLNQEGGDRGSLNQVDVAGLSDTLVEILIRYLPQRVAKLEMKLEMLGAGVRYRLGDYWFKRHDARGAAIFENLVAEANESFEKSNKTQSFPWHFPLVVTRLGEWYRWQKHYPEALNVLKPALSNYYQPAYTADWALQIAHTYSAMGDKEKAREHYAQVPRYGNEWYSALATSYDAKILAQQGDESQSRENLRAATISKAGLVRVVAASDLARLHYKVDELDKARDYSIKSMEAYAEWTLTHRQRHEAAAVYVSDAESILSWSEQWARNAIVCQTNKVSFAATQNDEAPLSEKVLVSTKRPARIVAISNDPRITVKLSDERKEQYFYYREAVVQLETTGREKSFDAEITFHDADAPNQKAEVLVHSEVSEVVSVTPQSLFFGFVEPGKSYGKKLQLNGKVPFRILKIEADDAFQSKTELNAAASKEHEVEFTFIPKQPKQAYSGVIKIITDLPAQKVIDVSYIARAK